MRRILILTAGFGRGHDTAAWNLHDGLKAVSPDVEVEVLDLFAMSYGKWNDVAKNLFLGMVQYTPMVWKGIYFLFDRKALLERQMKRLGKLRRMLMTILRTMEPHVVISTYPAYNYVFDWIFQKDGQHQVPKFTVVTDAVKINSVWYASPSDHYLVSDYFTANRMIEAGIPTEKIHVLGFPVSLKFYALSRKKISLSLMDGEPRRVLYILHRYRKVGVGRTIERLLDIPGMNLTIVCSTYPKLKDRLIRSTEHMRDRVQVLGWTDQIPELLISHHLVITKAGGAIVQEAIAARCPMVINHVIPGQEEGNAQLVELLKVGRVVKNDHHLMKTVREAFEENGKLWSTWREALGQHSRPNASLRIAELILREVHFELRCGIPVLPR